MSAYTDHLSFRCCASQHLPRACTEPNDSGEPARHGCRCSAQPGGQGVPWLLGHQKHYWCLPRLLQCCPMIHFGLTHQRHTCNADLTCLHCYPKRLLAMACTSWLRFSFWWQEPVRLFGVHVFCVQVRAPKSIQHGGDRTRFGFGPGPFGHKHEVWRRLDLFGDHVLRRFEEGEGVHEEGFSIASRTIWGLQFLPKRIWRICVTGIAYVCESW